MGQAGTTAKWAEHTLCPAPTDSGPCLSVAAASSLSDVLQPAAEVPAKYSLSPKACMGILRRASRRGRRLPPLLERALRQKVENGPEILAATGSTEKKITEARGLQEELRALDSAAATAAQT